MTEATQIVHWPGKDVPMCDKHAKQAADVARAMGFTLSATLISQTLGDVLACQNCENEAKRFANRPTELRMRKLWFKIHWGFLWIKQNGLRGIPRALGIKRGFPKQS